MNFDLIISNNSIGIKFGTCILNVLCQFKLKSEYYTIWIFNVERNLSVKIKKTAYFRTYVGMNHFVCYGTKNLPVKLVQVFQIHSL